GLPVPSRQQSGESLRTKDRRIPEACPLNRGCSALCWRGTWRPFLWRLHGQILDLRQRCRQSLYLNLASKNLFHPGGRLVPSSSPPASVDSLISMLSRITVAGPTSFPFSPSPISFMKIFEAPSPRRKRSLPAAS